MISKWDVLEMMALSAFLGAVIFFVIGYWAGRKDGYKNGRHEQEMIDHHKPCSSGYSDWLIKGGGRY